MKRDVDGGAKRGSRWAAPPSSWTTDPFGFPLSVILIVEFGTPLHAATLAFREKHLRHPLGLKTEPEDLAGEKSQVHIALCDDGVVRGTVVLKPIATERIRLRQMAVDPTLRGRGSGRDLVRFAENFARQHGYGLMELHARVSVRGFYESLGYHSVGSEFIEVTVPHIVMMRELGAVAG